MRFNRHTDIHGKQADESQSAKESSPSYKRIEHMYPQFMTDLMIFVYDDDKCGQPLGQMDSCSWQRVSKKTNRSSREIITPTGELLSPKNCFD